MKPQRMRRTALVLFAALLQISQVGAADSFEGLVAAIQAANSSGSGAITLSADIVLTAPLPPITGELVIEGGGHSISGDEAYRIFDLSGGSLAISDLTLTGGNAAEGGGGAIRMRNGAEVTIESSTLSANSAKDAGAILAEGGKVTVKRSSFLQNRSAESGGAVVSQSAVFTVENSTFHANRAQMDGGVFSSFNSELALSHVTMTSNSATNGEGDAIHNHDGTVNLRNSIIANRAPASDCAGGLDSAAGNFSADGTCGSIAQGDPLLDEPTGSPAILPPLDHSPALDAADPQYCLERDQLGQRRPFGGGCDIGAIEATWATPAPAPIEPPPPCPLGLRIVAANTDAPAGGCPAGAGHDVITLFQDIVLTSSLPVITSDITIEGEGHTISGAGKYRIFRVSAGKLTINHVTLANAFNRRLNSAGAAVGLEGEGQLEANHVTFVDNVASEGGAIGSRYDGVRFSVNSSHFEGNTASHTGGAISMNGGSRGAITNSSFVKNHSDYEGGAIYTVSGAITVDNSTFTSNRARGRGGALSVENAAVTLTHATMYNNLAPLGSGIYVSEFLQPTVRLRNSLLDRRLSAPVCYGRLSQSVGNFIADGSCSPMLSGDPGLAEASDSAAFLELLPGSPAVNGAHPAFCLPTDQTGAPRPQDGGCDIGAIEMAQVVADVADCLITTTHALNFRDGPAGNRIGFVPEDATLTASARTPGWFQVEHEGLSGWISADYVMTQGSCG